MRLINLIYLLLIILICSCSQSQTNLIGTQVTMPQANLIRYFSPSSRNPLDKDLRIITKINASCTDCIKDLKLWKSYMNQIDTSRIGIVFLCESIDHLMTLERFEKKTIHLNYPYFENLNQAFNKANPKLKEHNTFLIDKHDRIIHTGNPIYSIKIKDLFAKIYKQHKLIEEGKTGYKMEQIGNIVHFTFPKTTTWKNYKGDTISQTEADKLLKTGAYYMNHNQLLDIVEILKQP